MADDSDSPGRRLVPAISAVVARYSDKEALAILAIALLSAIFLAWSATLSLCGLFEPIPTEPTRFTIEATRSPQTPGDTDHSISIMRLVVDGRRARPGDLELKGRWEPGWDSADRPKDPPESESTSWPQRSGWAARLNHPNTAEPAFISFSGRSAALLFDSGPCGHVSISTETARLWEDSCSNSGRSNSVTALDLPVPMRPSGWSFTFWLFVCLTLLALVKPGLDDSRTELWLILWLAALHFLVWSTQCVGLIYDSLNQISNLKLNAQGWPAYFPPGYPLLVGFGYLLRPTHAGAAITLIQHTMIVGTLVWCFRLLRRCVNHRLAFLTALAAGAAAPMLFLPQAIMSENVALFGMTGALYFALIYRESDAHFYGVISGLLLGWAGMARVVPLIAGVPAVLLILSDTQAATTAIKRFATILATTFGTVLVPVIWFGLSSGSFALANSVGHHLYNRVVTAQFLIDTNAPATVHFLDLIAPMNPEDKVHWEIAALLKTKGLNYGEIDNLMRAVSWEGISHAPWRFLRYSLWQSWVQYLHNPDALVPWWSVPDKPSPELESVPILNIRAGALLWREMLERQFALLWAFIPWLGLAGLAAIPFMRQKMILLSFAVIPFGYILSSALVEFEYGRYTVAIVPFIYCLAAGPFAIFSTKSSTPKPWYRGLKA